MTKRITVAQLAAQLADLTQVVTGLADAVKAAQAPVAAKPKVTLADAQKMAGKLSQARKNHAKAEKLTVADLPQVETLPEGANPELIMRSLENVTAWVERAELHGEVALVLYKNKRGDYRTWGYKLTAKQPKTAVGIVTII